MADFRRSNSLRLNPNENAAPGGSFRDRASSLRDSLKKDKSGQIGKNML